MRRAGWLGLASVLAACAGGGALDAGGSAYDVGQPDIALEVVQSGAGELSVVLSIDPSSLAFGEGPAPSRAVVEWSIQTSGEGGEVLRGADTLRVDVGDEARSAPPYAIIQRLQRGPGPVRVDALVTDTRTDRTAQRTASTVARDPAGGPWLSDLRLTRAGRPVRATRVPPRTDSLEALALAAAVPEGAHLRTAVLLLRADSSASGGPLFGRAVLRDTVAVERVTVPSGGVVPATASLPALDEGAYAVELAVLDADGAVVAASVRPIVVRRPDFPHVTRLGDLAAPLALLADPGELAALGRGRRAFDAFWGEQIGDRRRAAETLRAFYGRVEMANRLFSTDREGWATDRGRTYVLFGPPRAVEGTAFGEVWTYARGEATPPRVVFDRAGGASFGAFKVRPDGRLDLARRLARARWRAGRVP